MRSILPGLLPALFLTLAHCSSSVAEGGCNCGEGEICDEVDQVCRQPCNSTSECVEPCTACTRGMCIPVDGCHGDGFDSCSLCGDNEVCVSSRCFLDCAETGLCADGYTCATDGTSHYCVQESEIRIEAAPPGGVQTSRGGSFVLEGAVLPWAGTSEGTGFTLTVPIRK